MGLVIRILMLARRYNDAAQPSMKRVASDILASQKDRSPEIIRYHSQCALIYGARRVRYSR